MLRSVHHVSVVARRSRCDLGDWETDSPRSAHLDGRAPEAEGLCRERPVAGDVDAIRRLGPPHVQAWHAIPDVAEIAVDERPSRDQHSPFAMPSAEVKMYSKGGLLIAE